MNSSRASRNGPPPPLPYVPTVQYHQAPPFSQMTYPVTHSSSIQDTTDISAYPQQTTYPYQLSYSSPHIANSQENFPYELQQPHGALLPSTFGAPTTLPFPDLNPSTQPLPGVLAFTPYSNTPSFPPTPQWTSGPSAGSPLVNGQDIAPGFSTSYQATDMHAPHIYVSDDTSLPLFDVILAKAREWMEHNPGQKVKSERLEGAFQQVHKYSWECLGCGETRKRREQIASHIRGTHLDNRGFYPCDEPGCTVSLNTLGDLKRHKKTHTGNRPHKCHFCRKGLSRSDNVNRHEENCRNNPVNSQPSLPLPSRHNPRRDSNVTTPTAMVTTTAASSSVRVDAVLRASPRTRPSGPSSVPLPGLSGPSSAPDANVFSPPPSSSSSMPTSIALRTLPMRRARNRAHPYFPPSRL